MFPQFWNFGSFQVVSQFFWVVLAGFGLFWLVPGFSKYEFKGSLMHKIPLFSSRMKRFRQKTSFFGFFGWRQHFFKKIFSIKWHGWLAYLLSMSHAKFQTCSFKGKKVTVFLPTLVLSVKILVCIFDMTRIQLI